MSNVISPSLAEGANPAVDASAYGTVIRLVHTNEDVANAVDAGFTRLVIERSTDGGISFVEITAPSERPLIAAEQPVTEFFDRQGDPSYQYRFRYHGVIAGEGVLTEPSEVVEGTGLATRDILTVEQLKARYLFGLDLTDDQGRELSDAVYQHYILAGIRWFEHQIDIPILPTTFAEFHDFRREDWASFNFLQLDNYPIISVEEFRVQYPSGQTVIVYPEEWLRLHRPEGQIQVVPTAGTLAEFLIGQGGAFLPAVYNGMRTLPQLFEVRYTAGFETGRVPRNIIDLIGMFASLGPFNLLGDLIAGAGIANVSLSMDGLSQNIGTTSSATNAGYGARIIQYGKQIKEQIPLLRRYYKGVRMVVG